MFHINIKITYPTEINESCYVNGKLILKKHIIEGRSGIEINLKTKRVNKTFFIPFGKLINIKKEETIKNDSI